jgi:hypothetical protein
MENEPGAQASGSDPVLRSHHVATLIGLSLNFEHIDPVKALFWAAILNGVIAAPLMAHHDYGLQQKGGLARHDGHDVRLLSACFLRGSERLAAGTVSAVPGMRFSEDVLPNSQIAELLAIAAEDGQTPLDRAYRRALGRRL